MRLGVRYDDLKERIAGALNLLPEPIGLSMFAMPVSRSLQVAQRTGMLGELVSQPSSAAALAERLGLRRAGNPPHPRRAHGRRRAATPPGAL